MLLSGGEACTAIVCRECAARATLLVVPERHAGELAAADVLAPFVRHLHKLALVYELDDEQRAEGLRQAAGLLEHGHPPQETSPSLRGAMLMHYGTTKKATASTSREEVRVLAKPSESERGGKPPPAAAAELEPLEPCALAILGLLASTRRTWSRTAVAIESRYSVQSGSFAAALAALRARQFIEGPARALCATAAGVVFATQHNLGRSEGGAALVEWWTDRVGQYAGALLLILSGPNPPSSRDELAARAGYQATSGSFAAALAKLRGLGLVERLRASDEFLAAITTPNGGSK